MTADATGSARNVGRAASIVPYWKYQTCVFEECPYSPVKLSTLRCQPVMARRDNHMAVYRVNKNRGYTVMANYHLRIKPCPSRPWGYSPKCCPSTMAGSSQRKVFRRSARKAPMLFWQLSGSLRTQGISSVNQSRDEKGRMSSMVFEIYEKPQTGLPTRKNRIRKSRTRIIRSRENRVRKSRTIKY